MVMVALGRGELFRHAVDGGTRRRDKLVHAVFGCRFQHIERSIDEHLEREPGLLGALGDADRGLVEDEILPAGHVVHEIPVTDVPIDHADDSRFECLREVGEAAAHEVVEHIDVADARGDELVDERRPDCSRPAGHEHVRPLQRGHGDTPARDS